nr:lactosylceramide 4-alpha-galactosyltransferase-like isoform X1 [Onthophagus taurus]
MRRIFVIIIFFGIFLFIAYTLVQKPDNNVLLTMFPKPSNISQATLKNLFDSNNNRTVLRNLFDIKVQNNSIFFLDTSLKDYQHKTVTIHRRVSCALESAALHHRNRTIYYVYVGRYPEAAMDTNDINLKPILMYENVQIVYVKIDDLVENTEIEELIKKGSIQKSNYYVEHFKDAFCVILLRKYGGVYMDGDVIILRSLDELGGNFVGKESEEVLGTAILAFNQSGYQFLTSLLNDLNDNYNPKSWGGNGPYLFTRGVKKLCGTTSNFSHNECDYLKIFSENYFFPVYYEDWKQLFDPKYTEEILEITKNSYMIHFWNKLSHEWILDVKSDAPYVTFAKKHCPKTISIQNESF